MNYFLNTDQTLLPSQRASSYYFAGAGSNIIFVDEANDLVVVLRWIDNKALDQVLQAITGALIKS